MESSIKKIVIVGGGFAGIRVALDLDRAEFSGVAITLINTKRNFEYYPGLYRIVMDHSPSEVCIPYEIIFKNTSIHVVEDTVMAVDLPSKKLTGKDGAEYAYDTLVLGLGSETNYFNLPGLDTLSFGFKSVKEALDLKNHIHDLFKEHDHPSQDELVSHFHIIIVGGGASGVELAGDLVFHLKKMAKNHSVDPSLITIDIIEATPRILPALPLNVSAKVLSRLHSLGVNVFLNRALVKEEIEQVYLKDMSMKSKTVIWTAGTKTHHLYSEIKGLEFVKGGRVVVDEYLQARGHSDVFIVGDGAATPYSGLAQTAIYDGAYVAKVMKSKMRGENPPLYMPKKNGYAIPVGYGWGIVVWKSILITGRIGRWIRRLIDVNFFSSILPLSYIAGMFKKTPTDESYCSVCSGCDNK